jgi:hypothetical protein
MALTWRRCLSESRFAYNHSFGVSGPARFHSNSRTAPSRKSTVYGLNGQRTYFVMDLSLVTYEHAI